MNGAESLLRRAAAAGIDICFANPGTTEMPLVAALDHVPGIRSVLGLFEGVCTGAADGYGRLSGRPALTLLHLGPGLANGLANLHNARRAHTPVVNLVGDHATWHIASDPPLASDIESLARPVSGWVRTASSAEGLSNDFTAALAAACGPPGAVATLVIPSDCQAGAAGPGRAPRTKWAPKPVASERIDAAVARLRDRGPAALLLGADALLEPGLRAAARVAAGCGAKLFSETFPARIERGRSLPDPERLPYFGEQAAEALARFETLLLVGARDPVAFFGTEGQPSRLAPEASPIRLAEPGDDAPVALAALADALGAPASAPAVSAEASPSAAEGALDPVKLGSVLASLQPEAAILVDEGATSGGPWWRMAGSAAAHTTLTLTGGAIGQGLPCATGAALACPDRQVIALQADGSGLYTLQALWTQAREGLDVLTLVCANRRYRILQIEMARAGIAEPGPRARALTELSGPDLDWVSLARGFGVPAARVETAEDLAREIAVGLREPGPRLVEVVLA